MATTNITIRIDAELKKQAEEVLDELGMNFTTAYTVFTKQLVRDGKFPFVPDSKRLKKNTLAAMKEADDIISGKEMAKSYKNAAELFGDIDGEV